MLEPSQPVDPSECWRCGYLARRPTKRYEGIRGSSWRADPYAELVEVGSYDRRPNSGHQYFGHGHAPVECFKSRDEIFLVDYPPKYEMQAHTDIYREHDCPEFAQYESGYAPKEFQELLKQRWLEEREDRPRRRPEEVAAKTKPGDDRGDRGCGCSRLGFEQLLLTKLRG